MDKKIKQQFTLIELLLVMGLMGLMVTLALPAFSRMTGNNKVDVMTSNIKTALEQGQSTAVSRNCCVAVVFPLSSTDNDAKDYNFGGYRLAEVITGEPDKDGEGNNTSCSYKFSKWISETYQNLPDGAFIVADSGSKFTAAKDKAEAANFSKMLSLAGTTGAANADSSLAGCKAVIFKPTGECVNDDMYICIATADAGDSYKVANKDDFRQIFLNQFTGRVDYVTDDTTPGGGTQ